MKFRQHRLVEASWLCSGTRNCELPQIRCGDKLANNAKGAIFECRARLPHPNFSSEVPAI
jgi:hypothetical protein